MPGIRHGPNCRRRIPLEKRVQNAGNELRQVFAGIKGLTDVHVQVRSALGVLADLRDAHRWLRYSIEATIMACGED